jgi:DNA segregation ATPase FtsK/SpoIIIE-like protein
MEPKSKSIGFTNHIPIAITTFALFLLGSFWSYEPASMGTNLFGRLGHYISMISFSAFGMGAYSLLVYGLALSYLVWRKEINNWPFRGLFLIGWIISTSLFFSIGRNDSHPELNGGYVGKLIYNVLYFAIGESGCLTLSSIWLGFSLFIILRELEAGEILKKGLELAKDDSKKHFLDSVKDKLIQIIPKKPLIVPSEKEVVETKLEQPIPQEKSTVDLVQNNQVTWDEPAYLRKYKNSSLFSGFFDDKGKVYKFSDTTPTLTNRMTTSPSIAETAFQSPKFHDYTSKREKFVESVPVYDPSSFYAQAYSGISPVEKDETVNVWEEEIPKTISKSFEEEEDYENFLEEEIDSEEEESAFPLSPPEETLFESEYTLIPKANWKKTNYFIPTRTLIDPPQAVRSYLHTEEQALVSKKIVEILGHYGVVVKIVHVERGPIITRYELEVPNGTKLTTITSRVDEFKLFLAVKNVRIVAPIPGKSTVGIEVPNRNREDVYLANILKDNVLKRNSKDLSICVGKDISGKNYLLDICKLPHLLVAGTTGSGKSVCLNSMITSLIFTRSPEELRFIMIDPKMVELSLFQDIPHLLMPVITDPKKATKALSWAILEMEARYQMVYKLRCRDLKSYNEKVDEKFHAEGFVKLPYIVIFIDELSDLMMVSGKDLEDAITRISQKSRAVGIHLVMATQRPSADVITGLIKANCPARIAFHVAGKTDSRIILDTNGAEALLGKGDFLYKSPSAHDLTRIQAPFVDEREIENIVEESKKFGKPSFVDFPLDDATSDDDFNPEDEEYFNKAVDLILTTRKASTSFIQGKLRIGYQKASRVMEMLENRGYVGPQLGQKPREILRSA